MTSYDKGGGVMLMFRKYSPFFTTDCETSAKKYAKNLALLGVLVSLVLKFPMAHWVAVVLAAAVVTGGYVIGKDYRQHEPNFAKLPLWKRLWVLRSAASFLVGATITVGVAIGITQWQGTEHAIREVIQSLTNLLAMIAALSW